MGQEMFARVQTKSVKVVLSVKVQGDSLIVETGELSIPCGESPLDLVKFRREERLKLPAAKFS